MQNIVPKRRGIHRAVYEKFKDGTVKDISDEIPFEIPDGWAWVRLGDVCEVQLGKMLDKAKNKGTPYPYLANLSVRWRSFDLSALRTMPFADSEIEKYSLHVGDILMCEGGVPGRCAIWRESNSNIKFQKAVHRLRPTKTLLSDFVQLYFEAIHGTPFFCDRFTGTTIKHLPREILLALPSPLPSLAEQKRIVEKIEKLMPLVEEYGKMEEARLHLDADLPSTLEKSILQEAIQGKLVAQDPNDEPASELLKRIAAERKALVKAGKLKRDKGESVIFRGSDRLAYETRNGETVCIQDEIPFEIPSSWEWVRLGNITTFLHRGKSPTYVPHSDCPMFAQKCNQWDGIHLEKCKFCDEAKYKTFQDEYHLRDYDVVVNSTGTGTLGRVGIFHDSELAKHGYLSIVPDSHVTVVRTSLHDLSQYIYHYLCTKFCWEWMNNNADGSTKQKELYTSTLASLLIPIPPLAEQRRIASAIPLLLNNCNQLKQQPTM